MSMKISEWLAVAQQQLKSAGIGTARLDALVLMEDELNKSRTHLLAHPEIVLSAQNVKILDAQLARRAAHEPLAYVRGHTEFYGREFIITPAVLEPRPESETMIDLLKDYIESRIQNSEFGIVDIGTGSGALAITVALELPKTAVWGLDIDPGCLKVATQNAKMHDVNLTLVRSDLLGNLPSTIYHLPSILLCNLPYVPDNFRINDAAMREPKIAIFGGPDGLDVYRRLFVQVDALQNKPLLILCESLPPQHERLAGIAEQHDYRQQIEDDFIQAFTRN